MKLIHRKQLSNYLQARHKADSCNVNSSLLSHWIHFCFPTGILFLVTNDSFFMLSSGLTWTHQLHQILQSFPSFVMWSNFEQLNCLHLKEEVMRFQRPERQVTDALSSKTSCPWSKCIVICPFYELGCIFCACFYNLTIVHNIILTVSASVRHTVPGLSTNTENGNSLEKVC